MKVSGGYNLMMRLRLDAARVCRATTLISEGLDRSVLSLLPAVVL